jgi:pimeloyl-ACP methyl ester carboxylesterase
MKHAVVEERFARAGGHRTFYLAAGPEDGPLLVFVHGFPELSLSWRHQLPVFGGLGFRAIAPDLRGFGRSTVYDRREDYAQERLVKDMVGLLDHLARERAVWIGHDWGAPVVWNVASHHPDRCVAVAGLCVPYATLDRGLDETIKLVDREVHPLESYPAGQWDYQLYINEQFDHFVAGLEADPYRFYKAGFRSGDPTAAGKPGRSASIRARGGFFKDANVAPDVPLDEGVLTEADARRYAEALERNGAAGPASLYVNHAANAEYAARALKNGQLEMPVLFLHARYDFICETVTSRLADPMRALCSDLTEAVVDSGHWMAQECPQPVNAALARWLVDRVPDYWPSKASRVEKAR